jgi:uncharacterized protein
MLADRVLAQLETSTLDYGVLLALDAVHREDGSRDEDASLLVVDNDFVADTAARQAKALFGASVHPYRCDAVDELERLAARGAVLVKWLPSAQNIQADHPRCRPFYEALVRLGLPLLCHTGNEHTLRAFPNTLNDPLRLVPALERGVTVIAAHCGARLYLHERSYVESWVRLARQHERWYGDVSAFGVVTRVPALRRLLADPALAARLVYGSDYPAYPMPLSCLGWLSLKQARAIRRTPNALGRTVAMLRALGVDEEVFARAGNLLRLPAGHPARREVPIQGGGAR